MFKRIKDYLNKRKEKLFFKSLTSEFLYHRRMHLLYPSAHVSFKYSDTKPYKIIDKLYKNCFDTEHDNLMLRVFVYNGGFILHKDENDLYQKVIWLCDNNKDYLITENIEELKYNKHSFEELIEIKKQHENMYYHYDGLIYFYRNKYICRRKYIHNIKKIKKMSEEQLKEWISNTDIKLEKYRFFYYDYAETFVNSLSDIDRKIGSFLMHNGVLVWAYDPEVYNIVQALIKYQQPFCFTENKEECKLNTLLNNVYVFDIYYDQPLFSYKYHLEWIDSYHTNYLRGRFGNIKVIDCYSPTLKQDILDAYNNDEMYVVTIQKEFIDEHFKKNCI